MGKTHFQKIHTGFYSKCSECGYELKNNKKGMKLHFKYSHPEMTVEQKKKDRLRCIVCKKENCRLH